MGILLIFPCKGYFLTVKLNEACTSGLIWNCLLDQKGDTDIADNTFPHADTDNSALEADYFAKHSESYSSVMFSTKFNYCTFLVIIRFDNFAVKIKLFPT